MHTGSIGRFDMARDEERRADERRAERGGDQRSSSVGGHGFKVGRIFGVDVHIDWSLIIIFALILFNLGAAVFPQWHPDWGLGLVWGVAFGAAVLFFASVLAHELSHAVVARAQGIPVRRITLFIFGGMAHMEGEPTSPKAEFWMAVVGPITSIVIGLVATFGGWAIAGVSAEALEANPESALAGLRPAATLLLWLGPINLILGIFNLVPGFPLDGGRVLRSILWWITDDMVKATRWASGAGRGFAWILMGFGVVSFFTGDLVGGLWLLLIGWFLNNAARMSYQQLLVHRALEGVPVARVMSTRVESVAPDLSVESLVRDRFMTSDQQGFPVVTDEEGCVGLVSFVDVRRVPQDRWAHTPVSAIMTPLQELSALRPEADAEHALDELARQDVEQLPVLDQGRVLGLVRRSDLMKWLALQGPRFAPA